MKNKIISHLNTLETWFDQNRYQGYDIYDLLDFRIFHFFLNSKFSILKKIFRKLIAIPISICPSLLVRIGNKKKNLNAKSLGLILKAYCNLFQVTKNSQYLDKAKKLAYILLNQFPTNFRGRSWGYPFDWSSKTFIPKNTPSGVVTSIIGDAFFSLYKITKEKEYLYVCEEICIFFTTELNIDEIDQDTLCFSYTPNDNNHVHNANLYVAEFLIRLGTVLKNQYYISLGLKAVNYTLKEQNADGSFFYWGQIDNRYLKNTKSKYDHYHTGFEIRSLYQISRLIKDPRLESQLSKYYEYYVRNYIDFKNKLIYFRPFQKFPFNIHGCAEFIILNSLSVNPELLKKEDYLKIAMNLINKMKDIDGLFIYEINRFVFQIKTRFKYFRWSQAWMYLALSTLVLYLDKNEHEENNNL